MSEVDKKNKRKNKFIKYINQKTLIRKKKKRKDIFAREREEKRRSWEEKKKKEMNVCVFL